MDDEKKVISLEQYLDKYIDRMEEAEEMKSYDIMRDGEPSGASNELWNEDVKAWADMLTIESLFYTEDWVFIIVDLVASKISSLPLRVMRWVNTEDGQMKEAADYHPLNSLIENPNPKQGYTSWCYSNMVNYALLGNSVNWYSKANNWLVPFRASLVDIKFDQGGVLSGYLYSGTADIFQRNGKAALYDPQSIIHIRRPNPSSFLWGLSPFIPGRKSVLFNRYSTDFLNNFYVRQAVPGLIVEVDKVMNETQALRQLRTFELAYGGRKQQRRTMLLPKGMKATPVTASISDQNLVDLINMNRETILSILKVPKHEVGLQEAGSLGSEESKTALKNFWEATLIPTAKMFESELNRFFSSMLSGGFFLEFDLSGVAALKDDLMKKATTAKEMLAGGLSVNEVRTMVWEVRPSKDPKDDTPFVSQPKVQPAGGFGLSVPPVQNQGVLLPAQEDNTKKLLDVVRQRKEGWFEGYNKAIDEEVGSKAGKALKALALDTLVSMSEAAIPVIEKYLASIGIEKSISVKAEDLPSKTKLKKALLAVFDNFSESWTNEYTKTLSSSVDLGYNQQLDFVVNQQDRAKLEVLRARDSKKRNALLSERGLETFDNVSKTHTDRIMSTIADGVEKNLTVQEIAKTIADTFADPQEMLAKATTIARTETLTAVSIGQAAAFNNVAETIEGTKKAWLNSDDDRVRDSHIKVSGEVVGADETFSNGLRWPRDVGGDPSETINCRCTLITLLPGETL